MSKPATENVADIQSLGMKATLPRIKILEIFQHTRQRHMSAEDVYKELLSHEADIGLATVYRVLLQFVQAGLLARSYFEPGKALFELNSGRHHDHLICIHCGKVEEFIDPEIERLQHAVAAARGFELRDHALSLYGVCTNPACRQSK
jgi:Fur family ferric uptake transcriptional regulator